MTKEAIILLHGNKHNLACDKSILDQFILYLTADDRTRKQLRVVIDCIREGLTTGKISSEPNNTISIKLFVGSDNDRIICKLLKRPGEKPCIVMSEIYFGKKTQKNDKKISTRYLIASKIKYVIK